MEVPDHSEPMNTNTNTNTQPNEPSTEQPTVATGSSVDPRYAGSSRKKRWYRNKYLLGLVVFGLIQLGLMFYYDSEPELFDVEQNAQQRAAAHGHERVTGYTTGTAFMQVAETLLNKRGGYLSNDVTPPSVLMDNIPSWEYGALVQMRDLVRVFRNDFSRSQSQSLEDPDLAKADPLFHFDNKRWLFPSTESQYRKGLKYFHNYLTRLSDPREQDAQFYARADNLVTYLQLVEKRLGGLSQKLSASVVQDRVNTDLGGDSAATQSTFKPSELKVKTSWWRIDDNFYEARGATWALIHFLKAIEKDFANVLEKKNATVNLKQIIRELEATQDPIWTPMILNGSGFGFFANHSLVMSSYISRANAALIDLKNLLENG